MGTLFFCPFSPIDYHLAAIFFKKICVTQKLLIHLSNLKVTYYVKDH